MKFIGKYLRFVVIGAIPAVLAGYTATQWQWWASCAPLWIGVWLRDFCLLYQVDWGL